LCLTGTGDSVTRDMFYDGRPRQEPGAIVTRLSPSFVRFGSFEIFAARDDKATLRKLADYVLTQHYPNLGAPSTDSYGRWFSEICRRTALMIAHWMRVGFIHGVMNTDNMSILGLTLDYGPYGFIDHYDPGFTPNTTDAGGRRYCYGNQPGIAQWNLVQLARALMPLVGEPGPLEQGLECYRTTFEATYRQMLLDKLGLSAGTDEDENEYLLEELIACLTLVEIDMTLFFRKMAELPLHESARRDPAALLAPLRDAFYAEERMTGDERARLTNFLTRYAARSAHDPMVANARRERMDRNNPYLIPRNYMVQQVIDAAEAGDTAAIENLLEALRRPYEERSEYAHLTAKRPEWARSAPGCSALSCSS
jgi:serine/tyrosine/threonine adenylyltransferase